jgi:hypothetical protein
LVDGLVQSLQEDREDSEHQEPKEAQYKFVHEFLRDLLKVEWVRITIKAIDLSYEFANLLQESRIITDIRPIFNEEADTIEGSVVTFTLRLNFLNAGQYESLSIAVDAADLEILESQCKRALQKAETALNSLNSERERGIPTTIAGKADDR